MKKEVADTVSQSNISPSSSNISNTPIGNASKNGEGPQLKKTLGFPVILLITVNAIMGTGIYFLPALGVRYAGPASIISWAILSLLSIYIAMCFGELASMFPKSGGVFEYAKQGLGRSVSFFIGWIAVVTSNITIAMLVVGAMQYIFPAESGMLKIFASLLFIVLFHFIAYRGMKFSASVLIVFAICTMTAFIVLIVFGLPKVQPSNFSPFFVFPTYTILIAIFFIAETFFGWESATFLAEETKDSERVMPKALILSTVIIAAISLLLVIVSLGNLPWDVFGYSTAPLLDLSGKIFGLLGSGIFRFVIGFTILGSAACWIVSTPRLILAMTKDKLFLLQFKKIHPKYNTPSRAIMLQGVIVTIMILLGFGQYRTLLALLIPLVLIVYAAVLLSVVALRFKRPELKRPYKAPFGKIGPIILVAIFAALVFNWIIHEVQAWALLKFGLSLVSVGIPLYFLVEMYHNPKMIKEIGDITARFNMIFEKALLPPDVKRNILSFLGEEGIRGKTVLDYGCGSGALALSLSKHIGPEGRIYATDYSKHKLKIIKKKIEYAELDDYSQIYSHITLVHDPELLTQVHPSIPQVDIAVSVNTLSSLQDVKNVMKGMKNIVKENGKICFIEPVDYFRIIPNVHWLNEKRLKDLFRENGFSIQIEKKKHLLWNYIYIYGIKSKSGIVFV